MLVIVNFFHSSSLLFLLTCMYCFPKCQIQVRNEPTEDFLSLLKEWAKLCEKFVLNGAESTDSDLNAGEEVGEEADDEATDNSPDSEVFEVERLLSICYGDPNEDEKPGLYFRVGFLAL